MKVKTYKLTPNTIKTLNKIFKSWTPTEQTISSYGHQKKTWDMFFLYICDLIIEGKEIR